MKEEHRLSAKEMDYVMDTDFLLTRRDIDQKINHLLLQCEASLKSFIQQRNIDFPHGTRYKAGKISKGENYLQLPYYILDYPRLFTRDSIFALRTMFWWGHYFLVTFHISGEALNLLRPALLNKVHQLPAENMYVYIHPSDPWQHHLSEDNYRPISTFDSVELRQLLSSRGHLKFCRKISLQSWNNLPAFAIEFFKQMLWLVSICEERT